MLEAVAYYPEVLKDFTVVQEKGVTPSGDRDWLHQLLLFSSTPTELTKADNFISTSFDHVNCISVLEIDEDHQRYVDELVAESRIENPDEYNLVTKRV